MGEGEARASGAPVCEVNSSYRIRRNNNRTGNAADHAMTLILTAASNRYALQVGDRLVTSGGTQYDPFANKSVYRLRRMTQSATRTSSSERCVLSRPSRPRQPYHCTVTT
jgi:hypothetical protein